MRACLPGRAEPWQHQYPPGKVKRILGSINKPAANALCRELIYALTPRTWLVLSSDAAGEYSSTPREWVVLDACRRMRCHGGAISQLLD